MRKSTWLVTAASVFGVLVTRTAFSQVAVATYQFNNTLSAQQGGVPALVATDPLGLNGFGTDTVFGNSRTVYSFNGNNVPTNEQAGLTLDTTGLVSNTVYSAELVFKFTERDGAWRRIIDVEDRQSDNGFYVDPSNNLDIFPVAGSSAAFTTNAYHHVVLTDSGGVAKAYLDGSLQLTAIPTVMDINNAGDLMHLFLDNVVGGGQGEFSDGSIALFKLYNQELNAAQIRVLADDPFGTAAVPEPGTYALLAGMFVPGAALLIRRRKV